MDLYSFAFRGLLTQQSIEHEERDKLGSSPNARSDAYKRLGLIYIDDFHVKTSEDMSYVYIAISAFENSVRSFIAKKLQEEKGDDWWDNSVKTEIRSRAEKRRESEGSMRWHSSRGESLIDYTDFGDLISIISNNWDLFEAHITTVEWAKAIITTLEKSRNVIMHGGTLNAVDIERVGMNVRDWMRQIG